MRDRRVSWRVCAVVAGAACLAFSAVTGSTAAPGGSSRPAVCTETGTGTGDWEVAFGRRKIRRKADALLAKAHRKGFRRAVIEREQCLYEVAVIHLTFDRAYSLAVRARKKGLAVRVMES